MLFVAGISVPSSTLYIANFTFAKTVCVSASFFISLNDGLSSIVNFIVFPSAVYFSSVPSGVVNVSVPSTFSTLNVMSFTFAYPSGANTSLNVYVWSMSFSVSYWYNPDIVTVPSLSVVYSPISSVPLYSLNFAPAKYSTSVSARAVSACAISSSSLIVLSVVFFTFIICKSYVGIFSFSISMLIVGIPSSSVVVCDVNSPVAASSSIFSTV